MANDNSISGLTSKLKDITTAIKKEIISKGVLSEEDAKDDLSLFSGYIANTIISDFENTLKVTFSYPDAIVKYIYKRFSHGGYIFYEKYQKPYLTNDDGTDMTLEEYPILYRVPEEDKERIKGEIREIFSSSRITDDNGDEWDIAYFPILNLTEFGDITTLFKNNRIVIGLPKVIYDGTKVSTLVDAFSNCISLHYISLKATGESSNMVPFGTIFNNCIVLEDFNVENIIPTNITLLANKNDIKVEALERLNLTHITSVTDLGYTFSKTKNGKGFTPNLYMPRCLNAKSMLMRARLGCGNLTFGVGCTVDANTFGQVGYSSNVGIISGLTAGVDLSRQSSYNGQSVHNWLYSVATDVRTYGHPDDSNPDKERKLIFHKNAIEGRPADTNTLAIIGYNESYLEQDQDPNNIVYIEDTLTDKNTLKFSVGDNELDSLNDAINDAINDSKPLKTPLELYDAIYNKNDDDEIYTRYYITALNDGAVATFHKCTFELVEGKDENGNTVQKARLAQGTIIELMNLRNWKYE